MGKKPQAEMSSREREMMSRSAYADLPVCKKYTFLSQESVVFKQDIYNKIVFWELV